MTQPATMESSDGAGGAPEPLQRVDPIPVRVAFEAAPSQVGGWRLGAVEPGDEGDPLRIELHRDEAQGYYLNVTTAEPSIFVLWRLAAGQPAAVAVTLSYDEAGRWMDGGEMVDRVPMPGEMAAWLAEYVQLHYRPEKARKRRGAKPSFMRREEFAAMAEREAAGGARALDVNGDARRDANGNVNRNPRPDAGRR